MTENRASKKDNKKILIILFVFVAVVLSVGYMFKGKIFAPTKEGNDNMRESTAKTPKDLGIIVPDMNFDNVIDLETGETVSSDLISIVFLHTEKT